MTKEWVPALDGGAPMPKALARAIYDILYNPLGNCGQSFDRLIERGGFAYSEIEVMCKALRRQEALSNPDGGKEPTDAR